ncbi:MAG: type IX secretion system sortase PorU [Candidatus Zixiibacteriota bacterium]|nr:MAG: type IX secretion system sortase PorU [candidate division Zixibacteria bacterium]
MIVCLLAVSFESAFASSSHYENVEILRADENGISFRLKIDELGEYIVFSGEDSAYSLPIPVLVAVPPDAEPFIANVRWSGSSAIGEPGQSALRPSSGNSARIAGTRLVRGRKIATVEIYPSTGNSFYSEVEIDINFSKSSQVLGGNYSFESDGVFDRLFRYSILNYDQAAGWPSVRPSPVTAKAAQLIFELADEWYKIGVTSGGLMKITGSDLSSIGISLGDLQSDSIHVFYGGGMPLPVQGSAPRPSLEEVSIIIYDGGDGIFDLNDNLVFYAEAADRMEYSPDAPPTYIRNPYTNVNCYWLAVSGDFGQAGKRVDAIDVSPGGLPDTLITRARFYVHEESNNLLFQTNDNNIHDFYTWYWSDQTQESFYANLANAVAAEEATVLVRARAAKVSLRIRNLWEATKIDSVPPDLIFTTDKLLAGLNGFNLRLDSNYNAPPYLDYCEVIYTGTLTPSSDKLDFVVEAITGTAEIVVDNQFGETPLLLDLSDAENPVLLEGAGVSSEEIVFQVNMPSPWDRRFYLCTPAVFVRPASIERYIPADLTAAVSQTDLIVIAPEQFIPYLDEYEQYREGESNISVMRVSLEEIINQFGFGLYDPTAIRDFLKYTYENYPTPRPSAVLLAGDGMYDFENILQTGSHNYIPPYVHPLDSSSSDDNYVFFGNYGLLDSDTTYCGDTCLDRGYDMMIARWPVRNVSELGAVVDKVVSYEASTNYGPWRTTVTLVADDEYKAGTYEGFTHVTQTETLDMTYLPPAFRRNKIYLWEYPFDSDRNKPQVNEKIVRSINDGTLVLNYVGHGSPDTWAHEHVFNRATELPKLKNADRLALVYVASCSNGFYDKPDREGMAEELLRLSSGGAIAAIAATRLVFAGENAGLNRQVYDVLFNSADLSICQSLYAAKLLRQYVGGVPRPKTNDRKYAFFGDPILKLGIPANKVSFVDYPDMFVALTPYEVTREVVSGSNGLPVDFNGQAEILIYDSDIRKTYKSAVGSDSLSYALRGPIVYRGTAEVINGHFSFSFIVPLDIGFGGEGAKIFAYATSAESDAFGLVDSIEVSSEIASTDDSDGPAIGYTFSDRENFISGDIITGDEALVVTFSDTSGINLTGGAGHEISLTVDNNVEDIVNLTDLFQYNAGSYTTGEIRYDIAGMSPGRHRFKIKAWDNANNSSVAEFEAQVMEAGRFMLTDVLNYPNPMEETTTFSFVLTAPAEKVSLEIFTLSGRKIMHYEEYTVAEDYREFFSWDGRDYDGDRVATGVYIYKVAASSIASDEEVESYGKVVVIN